VAVWEWVAGDVALMVVSLGMVVVGLRISICQAQSERRSKKYSEQNYLHDQFKFKAVIE
jgi:hypothetical protein